MKTSGFQFWVGLILILIQMLIILVFVPTTWIEQVIDTETQMLYDIMGDESAEQIQRHGYAMYRAVLVDSGINDYTYQLFIPTEYERSRTTGMESMGATTWFPWVESRGHVVSLLLLQVFDRIAQVLIWLPFIIMALIPAVFDGYLHWKRKQLSFEYASPFWHRFTIKISFLLLMLIITGIFLPIPVSPSIMPVLFMIVVPMLGTVLIANMPKRI